MSLILFTIIATTTAQTPKVIDFSSSRVITTSVKAKKGDFLVPTPGPYDEKRSASIFIKGDNLVVDLKDTVLRGTAATVDPDQRKGTGIFVSGKNITLLNAKVTGYKIGLQARNSPGLRIINCDFSNNWKPRLLSTLEKEDGADWMSYHRNENDQWLQYGAAIYLRGCNDFEVKGTRAEGGGNGLMLMESNRGKIWNNNFSFLSAIGLGLYMSSDNKVMHNKIDWCVRGFSYGVYNRGQDSAGILIYEQSNKNIFAYNSVTHGGDGFFLWAGQTTMDSGKGGCNDNLLYGNDFSHAPTNGIEATFSRNNFVNNLILECWHGIWGGYSYESKVIGNVFGYNAEAIAWEHGQDNLVANNSFYRDNEGIYLWSNPTQDPNWAYPKNHDTKSRDWTIRGNFFESIFTNALRFRRTIGVTVTENDFIRNGSVIKQEAELSGLKMENNLTTQGAPDGPASSLNQGEIGNAQDYANRFSSAAALWRPMNPSSYAGWGGSSREAMARYQAYAKAVQPFEPKPLAGGMNPFLKPDALRGWRYIMVDQWGPYDFKSPLLWPREATALGGALSVDSNGKQSVGDASMTQRFEILGPKGKWRLVSKTGYTSVSASEGTVPGFIEATILGKKPNKLDLTLEYVGGETTDYRGIVTPAGKPVKFGYNKFQIPIDWNIKFFKWKEATDPTEVHSTPKEDALQAIFKGTPLKEIKADKLDYAGYAFDKVTGNDHYATVAEGELEINPGTYILELTTDDGARVWLDGKLIVADAWKYQGPTAYPREVKLAGKHKIRVEHFQIDGYATLKVNLRPKS